MRAYTYPYQDNDQPDHPFHTSITFDRILEDYLFDRHLRLLIFDAIERIEIAFRTQVIHHYALKYGSHWYEDKKLFKNEECYIKDLQSIDSELKRSVEVFIKHYRSTYSKPHRPPSWMTLEVISFGLLSKLFYNLKMCKEKKIVTGKFNLGHPYILQNWMHSLSYVRNICAHHSRLWNRRLTIAPKIPTYTRNPFIKNQSIDKHKLYLLLCCIAYLMDVINPGHTFKSRLKELIEKHPDLDIARMGFPGKWDEETLWITDPCYLGSSPKT